MGLALRMSTIYDWDTWADNNESADDEINWREGHKPSLLNDNGRTMMKRIRQFVGDIGGSLVGTVTNNEEAKTSSIRIFTHSHYKQPVDGLMLRFKASANTIGPVMLQVDNMSPAPVFMASVNGMIPLPRMVINKGCIFEISYSTTSSGWILCNPTYVPPSMDYIVPVGAISAFAMSTPPYGWLECDGRAVSRETYKDLLDVIGLTYGIGDGDKTFNIPDLRGVFLRGIDKGRGIDRNRQFGTLQMDELRRHTHTYTTDETFYTSEMGRVAQELAGRGRRKRDAEYEDEIDDDEFIRAYQASAVLIDVINQLFGGTSLNMAQKLKALRMILAHYHTAETDEEGGIETRPKNVAILFAIKT